MDNLQKEVEKLINDNIMAAKQRLPYINECSNKRIGEHLVLVGEMIDLRNRITGRRDDVEYLYFDDGESIRYIAGFIGDRVSIEDSLGSPLHIGDLINDESGREYLVALNIKGQLEVDAQWIKEKAARKCIQYDYLNYDKCLGIYLTKGSCVEMYKNHQKVRDSVKKKMSVAR